MSAGNPLLSAGNIYELLLFLGAFLVVAGVFLRWMKGVRADDLKTISDRRESDIVAHKGTHDLIEHRFQGIEHKANNHAAAIDALDRRGTDKEVRLAKLELTVEAFKEGQARIEKAQETMRHDINDRLDQMVDSIREIREVRPK